MDTFVSLICPHLLARIPTDQAASAAAEACAAFSAEVGPAAACCRAASSRVCTVSTEAFRGVGGRLCRGTSARPHSSLQHCVTTQGPSRQLCGRLHICAACRLGSPACTARQGVAPVVLGCFQWQASSSPACLQALCHQPVHELPATFSTGSPDEVLRAQAGVDGWLSDMQLGPADERRMLLTAADLLRSSKVSTGTLTRLQVLHLTAGADSW